VKSYEFKNTIRIFILIKPTFFDLKIKNHFFSDEKINDSTSSIIKLSLSF